VGEKITPHTQARSSNIKNSYRLVNDITTITQSLKVRERIIIQQKFRDKNRTALSIPVLVVSRRRPRVNAIRRALLDHVPAGVRRWRLIEQAGPMEPVQELFCSTRRAFPERCGGTIEALRYHK
jgi:hypothetical protein